MIDLLLSCIIILVATLTYCCQDSKRHSLRVSHRSKKKDVRATVAASDATRTKYVDRCFELLLRSECAAKAMNSIEDDYSVSISLPCSENETVWEAEVNPSGWSKSCRIQIVYGSLANETTVDAIVNPTSEDLQYSRGVSHTLLVAGGDQLEAECTDSGRLQPGCGVCLGSGHLQCKRVIHVVSPEWSDGDKNDFSQVIKTLTEATRLAVLNKCRSLALPMLGRGCSSAEFARISIAVLAKVLPSSPDCGLTVIRFVLYAKDDVSAFAAEFQSSILKIVSGNIILCKENHSLLQPRSPVDAIPAQWQFRDDDLTFKNVSGFLNTELERKYSVNPSTKFQFTRSNWTYEIDFIAMTQSNVKTGMERRITRTPLSAGWYWKDDDGGFQLYPSEVSAQINQIRDHEATTRMLSTTASFLRRIHMFTSRLLSPAVVIQDTGRYTFDFINMKQINADTGHKRDILFVAGDTRLRAKSPSLEQKPLQITVKGLGQDAAEKRVNSFIEKQVKKEKLSLPKSFQPAMEPIVNDWCSCYGVEIVYQECSEKPECVTVKLRGWKKSVDLVKIQFLEKLTDLQAKEGRLVNKPAEWIKDSNPGVLKLVPRGSEEYGKIASRISESAPNIQVEKVERVQNEWLWEKYYNHRELIKKKNHGVAKERELFHGTRGTAPERIYQGEEGFDMRFSSSGMWGTGNYFAEKACYSHNYRYTATDGLHQMFLAAVVIGDFYDCDPDSSLRMPPEKLTRTSLVGFNVERYDSVTGETNGSQVYIIYDNSKAYPKYLITYTETGARTWPF